jgi:hypothetical protein
LGLFGFFFSHEIYMSVSKDMKRAFATERPESRLGPGDLSRIVGYRLKDPTRDLAVVEVKGLKAVDAENGWAEITFNLVNKGEARFPHLRMHLQDSNEAVLRTVELSPTDYGASGNFAVQQVKVRVQLRGREKKVAVAPYFEGVNK